MATITPTSIASNAAVTFQAATASDSLAGGTAQRVTLLVTNAAGSPITVTLAGVQACSLGATHNATLSVTNGTTAEFSVPAYCRDSSGNTTVTYSSTTSITVAAVTN
jgi:hypothetical protein